MQKWCSWNTRNNQRILNCDNTDECDLFIYFVFCRYLFIYSLNVLFACYFNQFVHFSSNLWYSKRFKKVWWISWMNSQIKVHSQTNSWIRKHNIIAKQHNLRASLWTAWGIRTIRNVKQVAKPSAKCNRNRNQNGSAK